MLKRIKELREDNDIKQKEIAKFLNCTQQQYSEYENGKRIISIERLILLSKFYNTSVDFILELTNNPQPYPRANH